MATLGTQNISASYPQVLKTFGSNIVDSTLRAIASGDEAGVSALQISTTGAKSTGTFAVDGTSLFSGVTTFGTSLTASTGTATIGTLSVGTQSIGTSTVGLSTISTATISTATISNILGATTFSSTITASTGTNTLGTISVNSATIGTLSTLNGLSVTTTATIGTAKIGSSGPSITKLSYGTAAFTSATVQQYNAADSTTGTFTLTGAALGDIVYGSINSLGSATGTYNLSLSFYPVGTDVVRYSIQNQGSTNGTIPAGIIHATAMRFTA